LIKHRSWNQNGDDDHLLLGFDSDCLTDYLDAIGWPTSYTRSAADEERNGGKVTPGNEIGYDLCAYIKGWNAKHGYQEFSAAEIFYAAGHPGARVAAGFLSHVQGERIGHTIAGMQEGGLNIHKPSLCKWWGMVLGSRRLPSLFVDYVSIRQSQKDFNQERIRKTIKTLGRTVMLGSWGPQSGRAGVPMKSACAAMCVGCSASCKTPEIFTRMFCVFEVYASIEADAEIVPVGFRRIGRLPPGLGWCFSCCRPGIDLRKADSTNPEDKQHILGYFDSVSGGVEEVNSEMTRIYKQIQKWNFLFTWLSWILLLNPMYLLDTILTVIHPLFGPIGVFLWTTCVLVTVYFVLEIRRCLQGRWTVCRLTAHTKPQDLRHNRASHENEKEEQKEDHCLPLLGVADDLTLQAMV